MMLWIIIEIEVTTIKITTEEKLMYDVMKAIYDSGIPISFKGLMVLKACLIEVGYMENTRHTVDIDANWHSDKQPSAEQMVTSLQNAIQRQGLNVNVEIHRMYGERQSAGFKLTDAISGDLLFTMDIDVNRSMPETKLYEMAGIKFCGVVPSQMIADKLAVISSDKVFRRIKDIVDIYYISKTFTFEKTSVMRALQISGRALGDFDAFLNRREELRHSFEKFRLTADVSKPPFDVVYESVKSYLSEIIIVKEKRSIIEQLAEKRQIIESKRERKDISKGKDIDSSL